jgi:succinate-acetate transporter protein
MVLAMAFAFGGTAQFVAALCELPRGDSFGSFWWSFALFVMFPHAGVPASIVG